MTSDDTTNIIGVVNLYALAVDTQRWDWFDRVFTADIEVDFGGPAVWRDLVSLKAAFEAIHSPFASTQHVTTNHAVTISGDTANCMSYVHGRFIREVPGGNLFESTGWYDDQPIRTASGWQIRKRVCRSTWVGGNPKVLQTAPGVVVDHILYSLREEARSGRLAFARTVG